MIYTRYTVSIRDTHTHAYTCSQPTRIHTIGNLFHLHFNCQSFVFILAYNKVFLGLSKTMMCAAVAALCLSISQFFGRSAVRYNSCNIGVCTYVHVCVCSANDASGSIIYTYNIMLQILLQFQPLVCYHHQ